MTSLGVHYQIAAESLRLLAGRLRPFVERRYAQAYPENWQARLGLTAQSGARSVGGGRSIDDPDHLVALIVSRDEWEFVFKPVFGRDTDRAQEARDLCFDIRRLRARYALHSPDFLAGDAWRLIDSSSRLLGLLGLLDDEARDRLEQLTSGVNPTVAQTDRRIGELRQRYMEMIASRYEHVDLGGIAPSVDGRVVRLRLDDIFLAPSFTPLEQASEPKARGESDRLEEPDRAGESLPGRDRNSRLSTSDILRGRCLLLVGGAGAGKSTFIRHLARSLALGIDPGGDKAGLTPVPMLATTLGEALRTGESHSILDYAQHRLTDQQGDVLATDISRGRALLLVDGIDEIGEAATRLGLAQALEQLATEHPDVSIICTARYAGYRDIPLGPQFLPYRVLPLDDAQVERFLHGWFAAVEPDLPDSERGNKVAQLAGDISRTPSIRDLAGTPLLLTIIALVGHRGGALPNRRVELFRVTTQTLLHQWPMRHGFDLDEYELRLVLGRVAARLVYSGQTILPASELHTVVEREIAAIRGINRLAAGCAADAMVRTIEGETGFLVEQGTLDTREPVYGFIHRSFAEYLAAVDLFERYQAGEIGLVDFALDERWGDAVNLFFAHAAESSLELSNRLVSDLLAIDPPYERHLRGRIHLALNLLGDGVRVRPAVRAQVIRLGVEAALDSAYESEAGQLLEELAEASSAAPGATDPDALLDTPAATGVGSARRARILWALLAPHRDTDRVRAAIEVVLEAGDASDPEGDQLLATVLDDLINADRAVSEDEVVKEWVLSHRTKIGTYQGGVTATEADDTFPLESVPVCSLSDLVAQRGLPAGFDPRLFAVELSDIDCVGLDDFVVLSRQPHLQRIMAAVPENRSWSSREVAEVFESVTASVPEGDQWETDGLRQAASRLWWIRLKADQEEPSLPAWLQATLGVSASADDRTRLVHIALPWALSHISAPWSADLVTGVLMHGDARVRKEACRVFLEWAMGVPPERANPTIQDSNIGAAIDLLRDDADPDVRADALRLRVLLEPVWRLHPDMFGEDGLTRPGNLDGAIYAALLVWLVRVATSDDALDDPHLAESQLGKLLDWPDKPSFTDDAVVLIAHVRDDPEAREFKMSDALLAVAWARCDSTDVRTRSWSAFVWAFATRNRPAENQVMILLSDPDPLVRTLGYLAIQEADLEDDAWVADAIASSLRDDDYMAWVRLPQLAANGRSPGFGASVLKAAERVLDEGVRSEAAYEILRRHRMFEPRETSARPNP